MKPRVREFNADLAPSGHEDAVGCRPPPQPLGRRRASQGRSQAFVAALGLGQLERIGRRRELHDPLHAQAHQFVARSSRFRRPVLGCRELGAIRN